jgi:hypothetical protein
MHPPRTPSLVTAPGMEERPPHTDSLAEPSSSRTGGQTSGLSSSSPPSTPDVETPEELSRAASPGSLRPPQGAPALSDSDAPSAPATSTAAPTTDELEAFRRAWQSEVSERKRATATAPSQPPPVPPPLPADSSASAPLSRTEEHETASDDEENAAADDEQPHSHVWPTAGPSSPQRPRTLPDRALAEALLPPLPAPALAPELLAARAARAREHAKADAKVLESEKGRREMEEGVRLYARGVGAERRGDTDEGESDDETAGKVLARERLPPSAAQRHVLSWRWRSRRLA